MNIGIGFPLSYSSVPAEFFFSFLAMKTPEDFVCLRSSKATIAEMRNSLVNEAMREQCTHLFMLDTDQVYHPDTVVRLLGHGLPVVGCLVHRRYPPFDPLMLRGELSRYRTVDEWREGDLVEVDATGTGCILFDMEVFRAIPPPWFENWTAEDGKLVGEDIGFCHKLRAAGYRIYVDTSITAGHLSQIVVTGETWHLFKNLNRARKFAQGGQNGI
jgi:hypothetical protein